MQRKAGTQLSYTAPMAWDGTAIDLTAYSTIIIWCTVAPSVAHAIHASADGVNDIAQDAVANLGTGTVANTNTISAVGRYILVGGYCWPELSGGTGGSFMIQAGA